MASRLMMMTTMMMMIDCVFQRRRTGVFVILDHILLSREDRRRRLNIIRFISSSCVFSFFSIALSEMGLVLIGEEALAVSEQWIGSSTSRPRDSRQEILQVRPVERRPPAVADSRRASRAAPGTTTRRPGPCRCEV